MWSVPFLTLGSVYVGQCSLIPFAGSSFFSGFFAYFWVIVWADWINECNWCLARGRRCRPLLWPARSHMLVYRLYDFFSSWVYLPFSSMLILSLLPLALDLQCTFFNFGFCVCRPRQFDTIGWELVFLWILCLFLGDCLGRLNQWM